MPGLLDILCVRSLNQAVRLADEIIELTLSFAELLLLLRFEFFCIVLLCQSEDCVGW